MRKCVYLAVLGVVVLAAASAQGSIVTLTDTEQMGLANLNWGDGSEQLISRTDNPPGGMEGVVYEIKLGGSGDGKFAYGTWSGNYADWSAYDGFTLEFVFVSSPVADATIECANFLGDKNWAFRQTKENWPSLTQGQTAYTYIDFSDCIDGSGNPVSITPAELNKICGCGFQVITYDARLLGQQITVRVNPSYAPEPATLGLVSLGAVGLLRRRRRR